MNANGVAFYVKVLVIAAIIIIAAVAGALAYIMIPKEKEEVRIGFLGTLSGSMAAYGQPALFAARKCVEDVNKLGGLSISGRRLPVKLIEYDCASDPAKATALFEQLVTQERVIFVLTNPGPPVIGIPVSLTADKYKVPFLSGAIMEPWWSAGPYEYAWSNGPLLITPIPEGDFRAGKPGYSVLRNCVDFTNIFRDKINGKIALFAPDDADGRPWYDLMSQIIHEAGYTLVGEERRLGQYSPGTMDFTAIIREWKDAQAEVLLGLSIASDFATMWRQTYTMGWKPKIALDGRALKNLDDVVAIGDPNIVTGIGDHFNVWNPYIPYKSYYGGRTNMQLAEEWTKETGKAWTDSLSVYSWMEIACRAIELAGSLDSKEVNQAMYQLDIVTMAFGRVKFIKEFHFSPYALYVGQWVADEKGNIKMEIVYSPNPDLKPTREPIFPIP